MPSWTYYPAFLATLLSVIGLTRIAYNEFDKQQPLTLSELAAAQEPLLNHFRKILWISGTLFAITVYFFIVPHVGHPFFLAAAWTLTYAGNLALALIPARDKTVRFHSLLAQAMAFGMLAMAYLFWLDLPGSYSKVELGLSLTMSLLAIMTIVNRNNFIFYELPFLFLSHTSILVAAVTIN